MRWFKHFCDASDSVKLNRLVDELGVDGYGRYWLLLELLAGEFDGNSTTFKVHSRKISAKVQIKFSKKLATFMQKLSDFSLLTFKTNGKVYEIDCPIMLELQSKDSKYNRKRVVGVSQTATLDKELEEDKELDKEIYKKAKKKKKKPCDSDEPLHAVFDLDGILQQMDGPEILAELWNEVAKELGLSRVTKPLSKKRAELARKAIKIMPKTKQWSNALVEISNSSFHMGENDRKWKANFDWLIKPTGENYLKLAEAHESRQSKNI